MKNVYVLVAAVVVLFGGILAGCTKSNQASTQVDVEASMNDSASQQENMQQKESMNDKKESNDEDNVEAEETAKGSYSVDVEESNMQWSGEKVTGKGHTGTIDLKSGEFMMQDGKVVSGEFVVDMTTIVEADKGVSNVVKHLKNEDFFDVEQYPTSKFVVTSSKSVNDNQFEITGDLTIKDKTNPITFVADLTLTNGGLLITTDFSIDRTKWDIRYGSDKFFDNLGDNMIKDQIEYELEIFAKSSQK